MPRHESFAGYDERGNPIYVNVHRHRRTYCRSCGVALDVGGGCNGCKPLKTTHVASTR